MAQRISALIRSLWFLWYFSVLWFFSDILRCNRTHNQSISESMEMCTFVYLLISELLGASQYSPSALMSDLHSMTQFSSFPNSWQQHSSSNIHQIRTELLHAVQVWYQQPTTDVLTLRFRRSTFGYPRNTQNGAPQSELGHWWSFNFFIPSFVFTYLPDASFGLSTTRVPHVLTYILP